MSYIEPCEAVNLEPLTRFKYRSIEVKKIAGEPIVICVSIGQQAHQEYYGEGATIQDAIFNAGIDTTNPAFTD